MVIIDDEPIAITVIQNHLSKFSEFEVLASFTNALEAVSLFQTNTVDLLFIDIEMPGIKGIDFIRGLKNPPPTIFTTAYRDYAVDAFDLDIVDYLVKPIAFDRFFRGIQRFLDSKTTGNTVLLSNQEYIQVKADKKVYNVNVSEIIFIESMDDFVRFHLEDDKIIAYMRLNALIDILPGNIFIRTHRSYIVNTRKIRLFTQSHLEMQNQTISIGKTYRDEVHRFLSKK